MSHNQSLLNARYDQDDKNEQVYSIFEHDLARDLYLYKSYQRQNINVLDDFIQQAKQIYKQFEMSGDVWDLSDDVIEATENAIITCNNWDQLNNNKGEK
jgi:hypothetical protein